MKTLKPNLYKDMLSILCNPDRKFRSSVYVNIIKKAVTVYPSKSIDCLSINRMINYIEKNVFSIGLIIEMMEDENEDQEILSNIKKRQAQLTIHTESEANQLLDIIGDYVKYYKILTSKNSFIQALDMITEDEDCQNLKETVDNLYKISTQITNDYNSIQVNSTSNTFDTSNIDQMESVVAQTQDYRDSSNVIITGIRALNTLLSPGYLPGCVYVYAGLPGNYKSGILLESMVDVCRFNPDLKSKCGGKTPISLYISMENTMTQTIGRLWSILYPNADITMFTTQEATEMIQNALNVNGCKAVILYYGYRTKSTDDIDSIISSLNNDDQHVVALFFDYLKRIRSARSDGMIKNSEKLELGAIMNEFKTIAAKHQIPVVTGHQLNRDASAQVDAIVAKGGFDKTSTVLGRSTLANSWDIQEAADFIADLNIENDGSQKMLMIKAVKQRDMQTNANDSTRMVSAIRHPFISINAFALQTDVNENCSLSIPIYIGKQNASFLANI